MKMIRTHYNENKSKRWNRNLYERLYPNIPVGIIKDYIDNISNLQATEKDIEWQTRLWVHYQEELIKLEDFLDNKEDKKNGNRIEH